MDVRWIVAVDGEVLYTTQTDNRDEAELWADRNLEEGQNYTIMNTKPEDEKNPVYRTHTHRGHSSGFK